MFPSFLFSVPSDITESELGSSDQEASPSVGKNAMLVLMPCFTRKCVPTANLGDVDLSEVPDSHLLRQMSS